MIETTTIEIILSAVSLLGMGGVSRHEFRFYGFILCGLANIAWVILGIVIGHVPYIILFSGYLIFNSIGAHDEYAMWRMIKRAKTTHNN